MDSNTVLARIGRTFEDIKNTVRNKQSFERLPILKKDIQYLQTEIKVLGNVNHNQFIRSLAMEGYLALLTAKSFPIALTEKRNILQTVYDKIRPHAFQEECLFILLRIQNLLCYYLIQLDQISLARDILESIEKLYDKINDSKPDKFLDAEDLFSTEPINNIKRINPEKIDKVITNNLQMQAFLYNKLNVPNKYTLYNHLVLRRQLEMKEGTPQDWALRTARLGNFFTYLNQLGHARHHLCAAYHILRTCHDNCKLIPAAFVIQKTDFEIHFLELSHHWVKYGLALFNISRKNILSKYFMQPLKADLWKTMNIMEEDYENTTASEENEKDQGAEKNGNGDCSDDNIFTFPSLDLKAIEKKTPSEIIKTTEDARILFAFVHKWLMRAKHYYDFEQHPSQYIACSLQLAQLYEHLAFFERNIDNQYSIQKRRADVLEALNSLLKNCDNVMSVQIDVIQELSQVQLELMALNLQKLWREESQTNVINLNMDADSIINSLDSESTKTLTEKTLNSSCKNVFLRKMEAATTLNGRLSRLSGQLKAKTPSELTFSMDFKN